MALDFSQELNFKEAIKNSNLLFKSTSLPHEIEDIFASPKIDDKNEKSEFWLMCAALKQFYDEQHYLPVSGSIPDMTSAN